MTTHTHADLIAQMRAFLARLRSMSGGIAADLVSAHRARGDAASEWMREDDADQRRDFAALVRDATDLYDRLANSSEGKATEGEADWLDEFGSCEHCRIRRSDGMLRTAHNAPINHYCRRCADAAIEKAKL